MGPIAGGPIDEECLADEVITGYDPLPVGGITVAFAGSIPKTRVVTGRTVVAHHKKFVISQSDGMVFGAEARSAITRIGIMDVTVEPNML